MNTTRRLIALFLALMIALSFAAVAAAEPAEELAYLNGQLRVGMPGPMRKVMMCRLPVSLQTISVLSLSS